MLTHIFYSALLYLCFQPFNKLYSCGNPSYIIYLAQSDVGHRANYISARILLLYISNQVRLAIELLQLEVYLNIYIIYLSNMKRSRLLTWVSNRFVGEKIVYGPFQSSEFAFWDVKIRNYHSKMYVTYDHKKITENIGTRNFFLFDS